ncbi:MAG: hypothetical protein CM15mP120_06550 [Pseudomonadota bacterium]|nr:MAG: hypothetical protein CM15mP120_06550 [Pseudomonadota bacterium]
MICRVWTFKNPEKAAQATLDAQRILGVDAAIMFADLLPILEPMGLHLDYLPGEGPVFSNPIRHEQDVADLRTAPAIEATPYIADTVRCINADLPSDIALMVLQARVYIGLLRHRRPRFTKLRRSQKDDAQPPRVMGTAHGQAGDAVSQLFAAANQCRGRGGSVVRHLGWQPVGAGLRNLCASDLKRC